MGLDNLPHTYPCKNEGTALYDAHGRIDCDTTQASDGCPWQREIQETDLGGSAIYGMLGVSCWYRGKAGNYMLYTLQDGGYDPPFDFFGGDSFEDGTEGITPDACHELATWMEDHVEVYAKLITEQVSKEYEDAISAEKSPEPIESTIRSEINHYRYAAWWLRFVADFGEGSRIWY